MDAKFDLKYLCWIMHRLHIVPIDEYFSLVYIWAQEALECYHARDRTTDFNTFLFHYVRCKWSNYRHKKDFQNRSCFLPPQEDNSDEFLKVELLADIEKSTIRNLHEAAKLIGQGYSIKEAAEILGEKPSTLYQWIYRYKQKMKGESYE